jgi:hypothetical protein
MKNKPKKPETPLTLQERLDRLEVKIEQIILLMSVFKAKEKLKEEFGFDEKERVN